MWLLAALAALVLAGAAGAVSLGRVFELRRGDQADLRLPGAAWTCTNRGRTAVCASGDAAPWAELLTGRKGITVRVHVLAGRNRGGLTRTGGVRQTVYSFTAFR